MTIWQYIYIYSSDDDGSNVATIWQYPLHINDDRRQQQQQKQQQHIIKSAPMEECVRPKKI